ncbi:MAG: type II toxin-antitoxin system PemK/MazF family toxin [Deltaproteobacteria bacterium]|nr:type II toxin-antitoxin system PemK/MazF family toxin [Deltaproteobacteria bacterium]
MTPRRGDLWWVRQPAWPEQAADTSKRRRPCLVVSGDPWNLEPRDPRVTLCPLTGLEHAARRYDTDVVLRRHETGLPKDSVARCVELYTVFRDQLEERITQLSAVKMTEVDRALRLYLTLLTP